MQGAAHPAPHEVVFAATYSPAGTLVEFEYKENCGLSEEIVKEAVRTYLNRSGYSVKTKTRSEKGADIEAYAPTLCPVIVEAKGEGSRPEMFNNFFLAAIGQILGRMSDHSARYVVALPWHARHVRLARNVPCAVRKKLNLEFWFVETRTGMAQYHIGILPCEAQ
jgi:hypothetical protein